MSSQKNYKVILLHNFDNHEIASIMKNVKKLHPDKSELIFAKTTPHSLKQHLGELIKDISEDHEYLQANPPPSKNKNASV